MKKKNLKKLLLAVCCAALLVCVSIGATVAYLTSAQKVVNTFTVGNVAITLDEAKVNADGTEVVGADRVKANSYKLLPGHTYIKDPTVTVKEKSESSYIKMTVTFTKANALDAIFAPDGAPLMKIFNDYDETKWIYKGNTKDATNDTRTYEFWYNTTVAAPAPDGDVELPALFKSITVPGDITNDQLKTIDGMKISVVAYAVQADGFKDAADAWKNVVIAEPADETATNP